MPHCASLWEDDPIKNRMVRSRSIFNGLEDKTADDERGNELIHVHTVATFWLLAASGGVERAQKFGCKGTTTAQSGERLRASSMGITKAWRPNHGMLYIDDPRMSERGCSMEHH